MSEQLISLLANVALTLSLIVAVIFGMAQVYAAARDRRERLTIEAVRTFNTREFAETVTYIMSHKLPPTRKEMLALPIEEQVMIFQYSQEMESLGILLSERIINLDIIDKTLGSLITDTWKKYEPMVMDIRVNAPDPFIGEYFQWLADRIDKRLTEHPRKPFFETKKAATRKV